VCMRVWFVTHVHLCAFALATSRRMQAASRSQVKPRANPISQRANLSEIWSFCREKKQKRTNTSWAPGIPMAGSAAYHTRVQLCARTEARLLQNGRGEASKKIMIKLKITVTSAIMVGIQTRLVSGTPNHTPGMARKYSAGLLEMEKYLHTPQLRRWTTQVPK
jgi:hypothetical protein